MIPEERQDEAIAYWMGEGSAAERARFEEALRHDPALAAFVHELGTTSERWLAAAGAVPAPEMRKRVLGIPRELDRVPVPHMEIPLGKRRAAPVALAILLGIFAAGLVLIAIDDGRVRNQANRLDQERAALQTTLAQEQRDLAALSHRDAVGTLRIASLTAQNPSVAGAKVAVAWDANRQEGMVNLEGLPRAAGGKDYQLWVIDASSPNPVGAGTLSPGDDGKLAKAFRPDRPVSSARKFAITVEPTGGSTEPVGPIVFVGG